jgi:hypothetical protein
MDWLAQVVVWLNEAANALGRSLLAPIGVLPGWLSATAIAIVTGALLMLVFKWTSNQRAIKCVRDDINAHLLALKLFKDSAGVALRAQGHVISGAFRLLILAIVPILVMLVPVTLLLGQLALWYESRPLEVGEEAVLTLRLLGNSDGDWPPVNLAPTGAVKITTGPVRIQSTREVCWNIKACAAGYHQLRFLVEKISVEKELAVGDGFMRVSRQRPGWNWSEALVHPGETPFGPDSEVQSIEIDYPTRSSWTSGTGTWVIYWFVVSMVAGLCFRPFLHVNV